MKKAPYCLAPFYHAHYDVNFENKLCCIAQNDLIEEEFRGAVNLRPSEFWTSPYMNDRRAKMARGEAPPECEICINPNTTSKYKDVFLFFLERFNAETQDCIEKWTKLPVSLDIRNIECNLKCVMCDPSASTSMAAHFIKHSNELIDFFGSDFVPTRDETIQSRFQKDFFAYVENAGIDVIYFGGGEPLMNPKHLSILDQVYDKNGKSVYIYYNTNLILPEKRVNEWISKLDRFDKIFIACSIDATMELGSYLRVGFEQSVFDRNLSLLKSSKKLEISLDITLTSLGFLDLKNILKYAIATKTKTLFKKAFDSTTSSFLTIGFLTELEKKKCVLDLVDFFKTLSSEQQSLFNNFTATMKLILDTPSMSEDKRAYSFKAARVYDKLYPHEFQFKQRYERLAKPFR